MIKRFLSFRWRVAIILAITLLIVSWNKNSPAHSSRYVPEFLSNAYFNEMIQVTNMQEPDTNIVLVNGPLYNGQDSVVGALVQGISKFHPKVIVVDYDLTQHSLKHRFHITDSVKIILAAVIDRYDSASYPVNIFQGNVSFGHVMSYGHNSLVPPSHLSVPSLAEVVVSLYDKSLYEKYKSRNNEYEYMRFVDTRHIVCNPGDYVLSGNVLEGSLKDKIVLVGKTGASFVNPVPEFTDNVDVHETPIGKQFGVVIIYNEIHTMLGNVINLSSNILDYIIIIILSVVSSFLVLGLSHLNKKLLYVLTKVYVILLLFGVSLFCFLMFYKGDIFVDYQSLCWTLILSTEISFWMTLK